MGFLVRRLISYILHNTFIVHHASLEPYFYIVKLGFTGVYTLLFSSTARSAKELL